MITLGTRIRHTKWGLGKDDADTTGAVYGQIAGAYYGAERIPERWRSKLAHLDTLESFAERLFASSARQ